MSVAIRILLAFTWELPQSILAVIAILCLKRTTALTDNEHFCYSFESNVLSSFSLGEFIFLNSNHITGKLRIRVQSHECGHSIQSRILGPLYLFLIAIPSVSWNFLSRKSKFCAKHYYDTPWEHWADRLSAFKYNKLL